MILLIDDKRIIDEATVIARTFNAGLELLESDIYWDEIIFDHDLGDDRIEATGYTLLNDALQLGYLKTHQIVLITANPVGRDNMARALVQFGFQKVNEVLYVKNDAENEDV